MATKFVGRKIVGRFMKKNERDGAQKNGAGMPISAPEDDSEFYMKPDRRSGKLRRTRKDIEFYVSRGVSDRDARILVTLKARARRLDTGINLGFTRCGYSTIIGFVPGIGDFADAALAIIFVVRKANQLTDAPGKKAQLSHMMRRIAIRTVVGIVPIVGDIAITFYRANTKNVCAIEDWLLQAVATANVVPEVIPGAAPEYAQQKAADQPQAQTRFLTADDLVHK